jgi:predicted RNA-binding protein with PUA-like domain
MKGKRSAMATKGKTGYWLFKQEPASYSFADLERDGRTVWDGVANALALQHLRQVRVGDRALFYHTGKEKAVVGEMRVATGPRSLETDASAVVVDVVPVRRLDSPVSLARIKGDPLLRDCELVRLPRLSVLPLTEKQWQRVQELSQDTNASA